MAIWIGQWCYSSQTELTSQSSPSLMGGRFETLQQHLSVPLSEYTMAVYSTSFLHQKEDGCLRNTVLLVFSSL